MVNISVEKIIESAFLVGRYYEDLKATKEISMENYRQLGRSLRTLAEEIKREDPKISEVMLNAATSCEIGKREACFEALGRI